MGRPKATKEKPSKRKRRPALDPEARLNQLIALAIDLAEEKLLDGTASSQTINYFLKLGSQRDKKELDLLEAQTKLANTKIDAIEAEKNNSILYQDAIAAMSRYSGNTDDDEEDYEFY